MKDLIESEWNHAENNGGKTFMGDVISGVTRALVETQNKVLYGKDDGKSKGYDDCLER